MFNILNNYKNSVTKNSTSRAKKIVATATIATAAILSTGAMAASLTPSVADYTFTYNDKYSGKATRTLSQSGNKWNYNVDARVAGVASAKQRSTFMLKGNTITPITASTTYKLFGIGNTHDLTFSNGGKSVTSKYKGKTKKFSSNNIVLDDLSLEAQIRQDLLNNLFTGNYYMAKKDKAEKTPFKRMGKQTITVPAGTFETVRIDRVHDNANRSTTFWIAPSLDYQTVKMVQNNKGRRVKLELTNVR